MNKTCRLNGLCLTAALRAKGNTRTALAACSSQARASGRLRTSSTAAASAHGRTWLATELGARGDEPKRFPAWLACACLALPSLVHANEAAPNAQALGVAESALNYCGPIDPAAADGVRQVVKLLVQGASDEQLAKVRSSDEYRKAYDSVVDFVSKIDPHRAKRFCAEASMEHKTR